MIGSTFMTMTYEGLEKGYNLQRGEVLAEGGYVGTGLPCVVFVLSHNILPKKT